MEKISPINAMMSRFLISRSNFGPRTFLAFFEKFDDRTLKVSFSSDFGSPAPLTSLFTTLDSRCEPPFSLRETVQDPSHMYQFFCRKLTMPQKKH